MRCSRELNLLGKGDVMKAPRLYNETYRGLFGAMPPDRVEWGESNADIINSGRGFMEAFDWTMQLQVGCPGRCLFCYVKEGGLMVPRAVKGSKGELWGYVVKNKKDVQKKLEKHLRKNALVDSTIYWSGITDPYAASPKITKTVWATLLEAPRESRPRRIVIQTRFRPDRDIAEISQYRNSTFPSDEGPPVVVSYSIGTDMNEFIRSWEKSTPLFEQRLKAIESLRSARIFVVPTISPLGFWKDLPATLRRFQSVRIEYITCLCLKHGTSSANTPRSFLNYVRQEYPELLDSGWQNDRIQEMKDVYGDENVLVGQDGFSSLAAPHEQRMT